MDPRTPSWGFDGFGGSIPPRAIVHPPQEGSPVSLITTSELIVLGIEATVLSLAGIKLVLSTPDTRKGSN